MEERVPKVLVLIEANTTSNRNYVLGVSKFAQLHGPWIFYNAPPSYLERKRYNVLDLIKENGISGVITCDTIGIDKIMPDHIPMVVVRTVNDSQSDTCNVIPDDEKVATLAAEHLLNCGLEHYGFCGFKKMFWSNRRRDVFEKIVRAAGNDFHPYGEGRQDSSVVKEFRNICSWLKTLPKPIGIFCCNDDRSKDIVEACKICGYRVPEDIAVIGVDNDLLACEMSQPPLSSIAMNSEVAGFESARMLHMSLKGSRRRACGDIIVEPTHVVARQSTDVLAIPDPEASAAVRFIRDNTNKLISVDDVASAVSVSRRVLETRFKRYLGRSIYKEIKRQRADVIGKLLIETKMPVSQIAAILGFPDVNHISRYFQSEKGMTLREFRKQNSMAE